VTDLEARLAALSEEIAWPPTPDLAAPVMARVAAEPRRRRWLRRHGRARPFRAAPPAVAAAAALLALAVALAASPAVRARLADWLGVGSVRIQRVERLPDIGPAADLGLGERTSLAAARRRTGLDVPVVRALGAPDAVYVQPGAGGAVSLVYVARPGLPPSTNGIGALLSILPGGGLAPVQKLVAGGVPITRVRIRGARGYFIGGEHLFQPPQRLAGRTLLWARDGVTYRLEGDLPLATAARLARTVR
jgi:hypothetical protein